MRSAWVLLAATVISLPASADNELYGGVGLGFGSLEVNFPGDFFDVEGSAPAYGAHLGWRFLDYVAVEAGYQEFAKVDGTLTTAGPGGGSSNQLEVEQNFSGFSATLVGRYPLNRHTEIYAKVGAIDWELEATGEAGGGGTDGTDLCYGLGANFYTTGDWMVGIEAIIYDVDTKEVGADTSAYSVMARAAYRFQLGGQ